MASIQPITRDLFQTLIERARQSPRLRINHNFHGSMEDNPHRFLNVMPRGTDMARRTGTSTRRGRILPGILGTACVFDVR